MPGVDIQHFYHEPTGTLSYVVSDRDSARAAVVDPVLGLSVVSGRTDDAPVRELADYLHRNDLALEWILETHAHADHLSGAKALQAMAGGRIGIGAGIRKVQAHFAGVFNVEDSVPADGSQFDHLFTDGEEFLLGESVGRVLATPGHTSDSITYLFDDAAFIGDTMFAPDFGTARCDFPGGDAGRLYDSIQKLLQLPEATRYFLCHDYPPDGRDLRVDVPLTEQRDDNIHVGGGVGRDEFIALRTERDAGLNLPAMILPALQVNIRGGALPEPEANGVSYLKIPLDLL
jgi:glyoxylase-like metal-dependent hydrolase (beta-lactamase superfamily II)